MSSDGSRSRVAVFADMGAALGPVAMALFFDGRAFEFLGLLTVSKPRSPPPFGDSRRDEAVRRRC